MRRSKAAVKRGAAFEARYRDGRAAYRSDGPLPLSSEASAIFGADGS